MNRFEKWVQDNGGPDEVARYLKVSRATVYAWLIGRSSPTALVLQRLVQTGAGAFDYDDVINLRQKRFASSIKPVDIIDTLPSGLKK